MNNSDLLFNNVHWFDVDQHQRKRLSDEIATLDRLDDRDQYPEERSIAIGYYGEEFFVVIYTWRTNKRRIISAWKAGKNEKREYQKLFN